MGQQQLLLIVLGAIVVGIAVVLAIAIFQTNAIETKRDIVMNEAIHLATMAQLYYKKPTELGGGGNSFTNWYIPKSLLNTASGSYNATVEDQEVIIIGTGNEVANSGDLVEVKITVSGSQMIQEIVH